MRGVCRGCSTRSQVVGQFHWKRCGLVAMTAIDINPVAWFILKCTLEYPHKLAGQQRPLPGFTLTNRVFKESFLKAHGFGGKKLKKQVGRVWLYRAGATKSAGTSSEHPDVEANFAWHVRRLGTMGSASSVRRELAH